MSLNNREFLQLQKSVKIGVPTYCTDSILSSGYIMTSKYVLLLLSLTVLTLSVIPQSHAESNGTWSCKLDGTEWKDTKSGASLNDGKLTLYSSDDRVDGIYIMTNKPAAEGHFDLNNDAQASFTDSAGANHRSKSGAGSLVISKYVAPGGDGKGRVTGTFSSEFESTADKDYALKDCTFDLPVKNL